MFYFYLLRSESNPEETYIGFTADPRKRVTQHNSGKSIHSNQFRPWRLVTYVAFTDRVQAEKFER